MVRGKVRVRHRGRVNDGDFGARVNVRRGTERPASKYPTFDNQRPSVELTMNGTGGGGTDWTTVARPPSDRCQPSYARPRVVHGLG